MVSGRVRTPSGRVLSLALCSCELCTHLLMHHTTPQLAAHYQHQEKGWARGPHTHQLLLGAQLQSGPGMVGGAAGGGRQGCETCKHHQPPHQALQQPCKGTTAPNRWWHSSTAGSPCRPSTQPAAAPRLHSSVPARCGRTAARGREEGSGIRRGSASKRATVRTRRCAAVNTARLSSSPAQRTFFLRQFTARGCRRA